MSEDLSPKDRLGIPRHEMPERSPEERRTDFEEVNAGLDVRFAAREALRCLDCPTTPCIEGCPVHVDVREFVKLVAEGDYLAAARKIREDNVLPAVTGRVCPQESQCEGRCVLGKKFEPLAIGHLERFVADYERRAGTVGLPERAAATGRRVAVVGSGPAGLSAAGDLARMGHEAVVLEALHELGGVLAYGIPEFRLPRDILAGEIEILRRMGVEFRTNVVVGQTVEIDELLRDDGFDAMFIATGAGLPRFLEIPGEHLNGVYSANEFLTRVNLMRADRFPEHDQPVFDCKGKVAAVAGGGNTALDAIRSALRLGARRALLLYRRGRDEMPARAEEVRHAEAEGIECQFLVQPIELLGGPDGWLRSARCVRMELGKPDDGGRRRPVPVFGSEFEIPLDLLIVAVGTGPNPVVQDTTPGLQTDARGYIAVDAETLRTSRRGVFAGGDIVTGTATVILAMGAGRKAARAVDEYLRTGKWESS